MRSRIFTIALILFLLSACAGVPTQSPVDVPSDQSSKVCGDGICDGPETGINCPEDCAQGEQPKEPPPQATSSEGREQITRILNTTSGAKISVITLAPEEDKPGGYPTLVLVPGGSGSGEDFTRPGRTIRQELTALGYMVVVFDPDGRGRSYGEEDNNGFIHQDALAAVIRYAADHPLSDDQGIGLVSYSFGITMSSGALARHPDLPVLFLIDWEGPADRNDTGACDEAGVGHLGDVASCSDEVFWAEREAQTFIGQVPFPYLRLQSEVDHVQPDVGHAIRMVNAAVSGASTWVRLNELPVNQTYDPNSPPPLLSEDDPRSLDEMVLYFVPEMFSLH